MKKIDALFGRLLRIIKGSPRIPKKDTVSSDNGGQTLKRARINPMAKSLSTTTETGFEVACPTKKFRLHRLTKQCRWVLTVLEGNDRGRQFIGVTPELRVGRQPENHICLGDPKVSRFHATIIIKDSYLIIKDLQSTNGTLVNNSKIRRHKLHSGDLIKVGDTLLQVMLEKD